MRSIVRIGLLLFLMLSSAGLSAQFYNGMQMNFGKNRLQYNNRYWKYYRFDRFDVYSYENGTDLSLYVAEFVEKELALIERFFDYDIERRMIFLTYNKLSDFRQSNIGLVSEAEEYNIGGTTKIIQNKVFLYFDGDHMNFERQIRAAIAEVLVSEMMFGKGLKDNLTSSTMINLPEWYLQGLISFVSNPWDYELENRVKDGIVSGKYRKFVNLQDDDARYAGHSFWKYVADLYGVSIIPQILYITKINKNAESGFQYVLGSKLKELSIDWSAYYLGMYAATEENAGLPDQGKILEKSNKRRVYQNIKISPDGRMVAYVTNQKGQYKIWIHDEATDKQNRIYKRGERLDQIHDYSFPELAWHPSSQILGFVTEEKGELKFHIYNLETKEITTRNLLYFEKVLDLSFSPDARKLAISAVADGQTDIWVFDIAASTNDQITNDLADDFNPKFINNMNDISFVSNRRSDTLYMENDPENNTTTAFAVYVYDYAGRSPKLQKISEGDYINHSQPLSPGHNEFFYLSDKNGIVNRYYAEYDSTISLVDTTIHYRYYANSYPLSNYKRNILSHDINTETQEIAEIVYNERRYNMYKYPMESEKKFGDELDPTIYRDRHTSRLTAEDSIHHVEKKVISMKDIADNQLVHQGDTIELQEFKIDINNYIFEREKLNYYNNELRKINLNLVLDSSENKKMMYIDYSTSFYPNKLVNQIDFSFLNASYQAFTGGAYYYNPGLNLLFKVGANDLFEDYRLVGGVRFATDFDSNEYLLSFENLKHQLDKQLVFHRQVFKNYIDNSFSIVKTYTHELLASVKYPLSQTLAVKGTASFRHDNSVYLSTNNENLNKPNLLKVWGGLKGELIYDNTRKLGTNLYSGMRWKVFGEAYRQINEAKSDLFVVGGDFRYYLRIHRTLIWANRIAGSGSFGRSPLIYYLGSVDNWINLNQSDNPTFNESVDIDYSQNYAYQALATNLRGFSQNIRNGSNFLVINTELRWPIFRYLAGHPLGSGFLNNFQVVGFADVGTAWTGLHPFSNENAWNTEVIENGPMTITIDATREPIVAGYGVGARAQLLGYFIRLDWAWGIENMKVQPRMFYLSLSLDF
jgi:Tol biopolymer transport system component